MKWAWVGMLAVAGTSAGMAQQPATQLREVTLNDAIQRALGVQPAMVQAR